jgi:hypothetical protein
MNKRKDLGRQAREAEAARTRQREGFGAVPNVAAGPAKDETSRLKEALHQVEEEKGDWSKDH